MEENGEKKKSKILILIICLVILVVVGGALFFVFKDKKNDNKNSTKNDSGNATVEKLKFANPIYSEKLTKVNDISNIAKLYDMGSLGESSFIGYSGYYIDGMKVIRNGQTISTLDKNAKPKLIKDKSDANSKYIYAVYLSDSNEGILGTLINEKYAYIGYFDDQEDDEIYDIYDIDTGKIISTIKDYALEGDFPRLEFNDPISTNSSKYLVVANKDAYGLIDFNGKKIIDFLYDDLVTIDDDELIAEKDGKFGIIDSSNKIIVDFNYDGLVPIDDYLVVLKDGKLGIIDYDEKVVIPFTKKIAKINEDGNTLRLCCDSENDFSVIYQDGEILISYYDATEKKDGSRYGYGTDYLVIKSDGTYEYKEDYQKKIYNYGSDYYYVDLLEDTPKIKIYDKNKKVINEYDCGKNVNGSIYGFVDTENIKFSCDEEMDSVDKYYNVVKKAYVKEEEVENFEEKDEENSISVGELAVVSLDDKKIVVDLDNRALLTIGKDDELYSLSDTYNRLFEDYYKLVHPDNTFEYYYYG